MSVVVQYPNRNYEALAHIMDDELARDFILSRLNTPQDAMFLVMLFKLFAFIHQYYPHSSTSSKIRAIDAVLRSPVSRRSLISTFNDWRS